MVKKSKSVIVPRMKTYEEKNKGKDFSAKPWNGNLKAKGKKADKIIQTLVDPAVVKQNLEDFLTITHS
jgi:hypothetical protein